MFFYLHQARKALCNELQTSPSWGPCKGIDLFCTIGGMNKIFVWKIFKQREESPTKKVEPSLLQTAESSSGWSTRSTLRWLEVRFWRRFSFVDNLRLGYVSLLIRGRSHILNKVLSPTFLNSLVFYF
jgi:hypothetical protein